MSVGQIRRAFSVLREHASCGGAGRCSVVIPELGLTVGQLAVYLTINAKRRNSKGPKKQKKKKTKSRSSTGDGDSPQQEAPSGAEDMNAPR